MIFPKMYTLMVEIAIFPLFTFYLFILTLFAIINIGVALKFSILPSNLFHIYLCQKATIVITKKYIRHFLCQVPKCLCQSQTRFIIIENIIKTFVNFQLSFYSNAISDSIKIYVMVFFLIFASIALWDEEPKLVFVHGQ